MKTEASQSTTDTVQVEIKRRWSGEVIEIRKGDRIAQMVVVPFLGESMIVDSLDETERGSGGFGSTGV
ncbi:MAG: hypothetical protein WC997_02185 [Porticoccaceae bacterium]